MSLFVKRKTHFSFKKLSNRLKKKNTRNETGNEEQKEKQTTE